MYIYCVSILNYTDVWIHSCITCSVMHIVTLLIIWHKPKPLKTIPPCQCILSIPSQSPALLLLAGLSVDNSCAGYNFSSAGLLFSSHRFLRSSAIILCLVVFPLKYEALITPSLIKCQIRTISGFIHRENNVRTL